MLFAVVFTERLVNNSVSLVSRIGWLNICQLQQRCGGDNPPFASAIRRSSQQQSRLIENFFLRPDSDSSFVFYGLELDKIFPLAIQCTIHGNPIQDSGSWRHTRTIRLSSVQRRLQVIFAISVLSYWRFPSFFQFENGEASRKKL